MRKVIIVAAATVTMPAVANATQWVRIADTDAAVRYIDADAIVWDNDVAAIWLKTEYANPPTKGEAFAIEKWMHDCANSRVKLIALTTYRSDGRVIGSVELPRYRLDWQLIVPNSIGDRIHQRVCTLKQS